MTAAEPEAQPDTHPEADAETLTPAQHLHRLRIWLAVFIVGLVLSGATAFPLQTETGWLSTWLHHLPAPTGLTAWIDRCHHALAETNAAYPFLAYGTDWLAFAHLTIAVAFYGPWRDPVRNKWDVLTGLDRVIWACFLAATPERSVDRCSSTWEEQANGFRKRSPEC